MTRPSVPTDPQPTPGAQGTPPASWSLGEVHRVRVPHLARAKSEGQRATWLTAYDALTAPLFDAAGIDVLLVGDSLGNVLLGFDSTIPVTLEHMLVATRAVSGSVRRALVVADLPMGTYEVSPAQAHASAVRLVKEAGAHAVKLEGGAAIVPQIELLTRAGIPVIGHLGFTPQAENVLGGHRVQGRGEGAAERLLADALSLEAAGVGGIVLEMVPAPVASRVTRALTVPTIGIGAGAQCDGQVLVWSDMAGMGGEDGWSPRFAKQYAHLGDDLRRAAADYAAEVRAGTFPDAAHSFEH